MSTDVGAEKYSRVLWNNNSKHCVLAIPLDSVGPWHASGSEAFAWGYRLWWGLWIAFLSSDRG